MKEHKKYIERKPLLELYENTEDCNIDNFHVPIMVIRQNILDQPIADVVEVVRCKDCAFSCFVSQYSKYECSRYGVLLFSNDFCSCGERKIN